jgi:hypothetical protein
VKCSFESSLCVDIVAVPEQASGSKDYNDFIPSAGRNEEEGDLEVKNLD